MEPSHKESYSQEETDKLSASVEVLAGHSAVTEKTVIISAIP